MNEESKRALGATASFVAVVMGLSSVLAISRDDGILWAVTAFLCAVAFAVREAVR